MLRKVIRISAQLRAVGFGCDIFYFAVLRIDESSRSCLYSLYPASKSLFSGWFSFDNSSQSDHSSDSLIIHGIPSYHHPCTRVHVNSQLPHCLYLAFSFLFEHPVDKCQIYIYINQTMTVQTIARKVVLSIRSVGVHCILCVVSCLWCTCTHTRYIHIHSHTSTSIHIHTYAVPICLTCRLGLRTC